MRVLDQTGSTNDDARELALGGAPHGAAVAARRQTAGRGRRGHAWASPAGNLYLSVVLRPRVAPARLAGLAAACGVGAVRGLRAACGAGAGAIRLKWPNDLFARGRKLGGMLIETGSDPRGDAFAICGIGVNVAVAPRDLEATCLEELGAPSDLDGLAEALRVAIAGRVAAWGASDGTRPLDGVLDAYLDLLAWQGDVVRVLSPDGAELARGALDGVDAWGRAVVDGTPYPCERASLRPA